MERALNYVKGSIKEGEVRIYRIVPIEELSSSPRMTETMSASTKGIAIVEAGSIEAVRRMVENILEGLTFGGFPVARNYLEFDISPLIEITEEGGKT